MNDRQKITVWILSVLSIGGIVVLMLLPSKSRLSSLDFTVSDSDGNTLFEVNEPLEFVVSDSVAVRGKQVTWQMGNGDERKNPRMEYSYKTDGDYRVTLYVKGKPVVDKILQVIPTTIQRAADSLITIYANSVGYVGEEIVFSAIGPGMTEWKWRFGETGMQDAADQQVVYVYSKPGKYEVQLKTNANLYAVTHNIEIRERYKKVLEMMTEDPKAAAEEDIRLKLQEMIKLDASDKKNYNRIVTYIKGKYICRNTNPTVVTNNSNYDNFEGYCKGIVATKTIIITEVKIDRSNCISELRVTQSKK